MEVKINKDVILGVMEFAKTAHPKESMVLLQGKMSKEIVIVESLVYQHIIADKSTAIITHGYAISNIVGSCHSHPGASNRPSSADLRYFNKYPGVHLIIKMPYNEESIVCYNHLGFNLRFSII